MKIGERVTDHKISPPNSYYIRITAIASTTARLAIRGVDSALLPSATSFNSKNVYIILRD